MTSRRLGDEKKVLRSYRFPRAVRDRLQMLAESKGVTMTQVVRWLIESAETKDGVLMLWGRPLNVNKVRTP